MAQTGFTPILTYASGTASNVPLAANLTSSASGAELALNYADGRLFYKDSGGVVQVLATKATGSIGGSNTQVQFNSSGSLAGSANMVFNGTRLTVADLADSGLTAGRVTYASSGGALVDSANLLFDGTTLTANALTTTSTVTINGGTANGVAYLNGSKVLTTGSALQFDGGNLGLGVTPSAWASGSGIQFQDGVSFTRYGYTRNAYFDGSNYRYISTAVASWYLQAAGAHSWWLAPSGTAGNAISFTQAMTLNASGNLGVGTTNPQRLLHLNGSVGSMRLEGSSVGGYIEIIGPSNTNYIGTPAAISSGSTTDLAFFLSGSERARITSGGDLLVGRTSGFAFAASRLVVEHGQPDYVQAIGNSHPSSPFGIAMRYTAASPNNTGSAYIYADDSGGTQRFSVRSNGGVYNFQGNNVNLSDRREKTNFAPAGEYLSKICAIPVQTFNYIDQNMEEDPGETLGVVAQDVQAVAPELVMESNWGTEENPRMRLSIYQTDLQYALMKCIQEQQQLITALTARIAALEAK
jgi:hypothetical protein